MSLNTYWENHLRVAYELAEPRLFLPMVQASRAHVVMLAECGLLPAERARVLLTGLNALQEPQAAAPFDGSFEDVYYLLEKRLAEAAGIEQTDLDVQLARSRNDLDAGVFRWGIRADLLQLGDLVTDEAQAAATAADRYADALIIGFTHRRPAQPTTIGHVLAGLAEARLSLLHELLAVYDEINVSPLGSAAFAGTDLPIDAGRVAELLGFASTFTSSYEAVAGAEHLFRPAALYARYSVTSARFARTLLDWMTAGWVQTPTGFTQGSSIMPQKKNPVVLEHLWSYAGAAAGDLASVANNIGAAWYEDSNNATTDVQQHLERSADRVIRTSKLVGGLLKGLQLGTLPNAREIVASGATSTSAAEALALQGIPWRGAHAVVHQLVQSAAPTEWNVDIVAHAIAEAGFERLSDDAVAGVVAAATDPARVLGRRQAGSPGAAAVRACAAATAEQLADVRGELASREQAVSDAAERLDRAVDKVIAS
ncbi:MAG: lyase family protein [Nakamurella sp.]